MSMGSINWDNIGNRIRFLRKKRNWTQEQMAQKLHITSQYFGYIERGQRPISLELLCAIAQALQCSLYDLVPLKHENTTADKEECFQIIQQLDDKKAAFVKEFLETYAALNDL